MASGAISAYGTLLKRETSPGSGTFSTIAEVRSMSGPSMKISELDVTTHSSAASGAYREFRPSLIDPGEYSFTINFIPASVGHKAMLADFTTRTLANYKTVYPDVGLTEHTFSNAYISQFSIKAETDGILEADITLRLSGAPGFPA